MNQRASAFWARLKANRPAYTLSILLTLAVGILIGTVISYGVKGQDKKASASDATPLTVPSPQLLSNQFSQISKQLEPSVVNINTESTIKAHAAEAAPRAVRMTMMSTRSTISLTAFSAVRVARAARAVRVAARFVNVRSVPA